MAVCRATEAEDFRIHIFQTGVVVNALLIDNLIEEDSVNANDLREWAETGNEVRIAETRRTEITTSMREAREDRCATTRPNPTMTTERGLQNENHDHEWTEKIKMRENDVSWPS